VAIKVKGRTSFHFRRAEPKLVPKSAKRSPRAPQRKDPSDEPPYFVKGQKAGSKDEYWMGLALDQIEEQTGWTWEYQVPVQGGRRRRGGNVVDALVHTPGMWTMIDPKGRYWHTGHHEDQQEMRDVARLKKWRLIEYFTDEHPTKEAVLSHLRKELHV
jgi:hypothetical protein